jgi:hypothetical protein
MKRRLLQSLVLALSTAALLVLPSTKLLAQTTSQVSATIDTNTVVGSQIDTRSLGLSFETGDMGLFVNPSLRFKNLVKGLAKTLRIGGSSTDITCLAKYNGKTPNCKISLTQERVDAVMALAAELKLPVTFGLNFMEPSLIVEEGKFVQDSAAKYGVALTIAPGNEPDLFPLQNKIGVYSNKDASGKSTWIWDNDYMAVYSPIAEDLMANFPNLPVQAPAICCRLNDFANSLIKFANQEVSRVDYISIHPYLSSACDKTKLPTLDYILSEDRMIATRKKFGKITPSISQNLVLEETNMMACGGTDLARTQAAGIDSADWYFEWLQMGARRFGFHNAGVYYAPIVVDKTGLATVNPNYYALFMASFAQNKQLVSVVKTGIPNVKIWAAKRPDGQTMVWILNKDLNFSGNVTIDIPGKTGNIGVYTLSSPSLTATTGVKFGRDDIKADGTLAYSPDSFVSSASSEYVVDMPNGSAKMLVFK